MGCSRYLFDALRVPPILSPVHNAADSRERVELYEAAQIIQHAFRLYKKRQRLLRQIEEEKQHRHAAVVIQSYYRRYKQYCYFKKVQHAASVIQKYFRKRRATLDGAGTQRRPTEAKVLSIFNVEKPSVTDCTKLVTENGEVDAQFAKEDSLLENVEEKAAIIIQHAFRVEIKRDTKKRRLDASNEDPKAKRSGVD